MIVDDKKADIITSGKITESFFTVKQENLAHIFSILRNSLYSDKAGAIIREYSTNAMDAHVQSGIQSKPISIHCPTRFSPTLIIRDYGFGLSEFDIYNVFSSYGESTKRNTNDQVGMMGLGSKSAFCYTDTFTIISHHEGVKKSYLAYIDETNIGKVMMVNEEPTSETGLEIQVPVKTYECYQFENAITKELRFFDPKPVVNIPNLQSDLDNFTLKYHVEGEGYKIFKSSYEENMVVMGNVAYPFDERKLSQNVEYADAVSLLFDYSVKIVLFANIGDVIPSASRESLEMREKTVTWLGNKLNDVAKNVKGNICSQLDIYDTIWDARCFFNTLMQRYQNLISGYTKEGYQMNSGYVTVPAGMICRNMVDGKLENVTTTIRCSHETKIYYNKSNISKASMKKRIIQDSGTERNSYAIELNGKSVEELLTNPEFIGANLIDFDTIVLPKIVRTRSQSRTDIAYRYLKNGCVGKESWEECKINFKQGSGIYIPIKFFETSLFHSSALRSIFSALESLEIDIELYGVRHSDVDKLNPNWTYFVSFLRQLGNSISDNYKEQFITGYIRRNISFNTHNLYDAFANQPNDPFDFKSYVDFQSYNYSIFSALNTLHNNGYVYTDLTNAKELIKKLDSFSVKYPLLEFVTVDSKTLPAIKEYIEAMDK